MLNKFIKGIIVIPLFTLIFNSCVYAQVGGPVLIQGVYNGTTIKYINVDSSGSLILSAAGTNPAAGATGSAVPSYAGYTGVNIGGTLTGLTGTTVSSSKALDVNVVAGAATGVAQASTTSGQLGQLIQCAVTTSAPAYTTAQTDPLSCTTGGGLRISDSTLEAAIVPISSACAILSTASTNSISCKGSAGNRTGFFAINTTATLYYLRLYNTASAPTCSSATGFIQSIPIPASTTGAGIVVNIPNSVAFATGLGYCLTGGSSSTDNTNAATGVFGEIYYN